MIILGWSKRLVPTRQIGQFHCPECGVPYSYAECNRTTYFCLFFIPLIPLSSFRDGLQCCGCKKFFDEGVLAYRPREKATSWTCKQCHRPWPETYVRCPICKIRPDGTPA